MQIYIDWLLQVFHCVKSVQTRSFLWSVFYRIRAEYGKILFFKTVTYSFLSNNSFNIHLLRIFLFRILLIRCKWNAAAVNSYNLYLIYYSVSLRIQSECGKIGTGKTSVFGHFSRSVQHINTKWPLLWK